MDGLQKFHPSQSSRLIVKKLNLTEQLQKMRSEVSTKSAGIRKATFEQQMPVVAKT